LADEAHTPASSDSAARGEIIGTDEKGDKVEAAPVSNNTVDSPSDKDTQQEEKRQEIRPGTSDGQKDPRNAVNHGGKQNVPSDANKAVEMDDKGKRDTAAVAAVREAGDEGAGTKDDDAVNGVEKRNVQNGANELVETKNKGNQGAAAGEQADDENTEHQNDAGSQKNPPESNKPVNVKEDTKDAADQKEAAAADKDTDEQEDPRDANADQQKSPEDDKKNDVEKHKDEKTEDEHEDKGAAGRAETKESQGVEKEKANDDDNVDKDDDNEGGDGGNDDETETNKNRAPGAGIDEKGLKDTAAGAQVAKPGPDNTYGKDVDNGDNIKYNDNNKLLVESEKNTGLNIELGLDNDSDDYDDHDINEYDDEGNADNMRGKLDRELSDRQADKGGADDDYRADDDDDDDDDDDNDDDDAKDTDLAVEYADDGLKLDGNNVYNWHETHLKADQDSNVLRSTVLNCQHVLQYSCSTSVACCFTPCSSAS